MKLVCLVLCVYTLQVNSFDSKSGKYTPPVYLPGSLVPYFVPPPPILRASALPHLVKDRLHVPPTLHGIGHHPVKPLLPLPGPAHVNKLPHSPIGHSLHLPHLPHQPLIPHSKIPEIVVTPPHVQKTLRSAGSSLSHLSPSTLSHLPNLHPSHPLTANKDFLRLADPRHLHIHHHGSFQKSIHKDIFHEEVPHEVHHIEHHHHHHVPVHHHHINETPKKLLIKKTIVKKFRDALEPHRRLRRALPSVLATKLITDPKSKVDLKGTLDNVRNAAKDVCESLQSPVYHVRDAIGSIRDVAFSAMKMSPTGLLIPSTYGVMELKPGAETVGAINPEIYKYDHNGKPTEIRIDLKAKEMLENPEETLNAVQFMLRNGFRKGSDSIQHAGDAVHSIRRAVLTVPQSALKLLYPFYKSIELRQDKDGFKPTGLLGAQAAVADSTPRLVGVGRLLELLKAATNSDSLPEQVSIPLSNAISANEERREKYKNFIKKLRSDAREKIQSLN